MKSITYMETRLTTLGKYWFEFYDRDFQRVLDSQNAEKPYVVDSKFQALQADYISIKAQFNIVLQNLGHISVQYQVTQMLLEFQIALKLP